MSTAVHVLIHSSFHSRTAFVANSLISVSTAGSKIVISSLYGNRYMTVIKTHYWLKMLSKSNIRTVGMVRKWVSKQNVLQRSQQNWGTETVKKWKCKKKKLRLTHFIIFILSFAFPYLLVLCSTWELFHKYRATESLLVCRSENGSLYSQDPTIILEKWERRLIVT